ARARRAQRDADLARGLRVGRGGMAAAGLVTHEDAADARVHESVVRREVRASGIPEYDVPTFCLKALHHGIDRSHALDLLSSKVRGLVAELQRAARQAARWRR